MVGNLASWLCDRSGQDLIAVRAVEMEDRLAAREALRTAHLPMLLSAKLCDNMKPTKNSPKIESNDLDPVTMPRIGTRQMGNSKGVVDGL